MKLRLRNRGKRARKNVRSWEDKEGKGGPAVTDTTCTIIVRLAVKILAEVLILLYKGKRYRLQEILVNQS